MRARLIHRISSHDSMPEHSAPAEGFASVQKRVEKAEVSWQATANGSFGSGEGGVGKARA
jgi:hypothetical protein